MRTVVTGSAGFLGSHLCARLLRDGHYVLGLDDYSTGSTVSTDALSSHPRFTFLRWDITAFRDLFDVDRIYHLACPASPVAYQQDPVRTMRVNVVGTNNLLEMARRCNARILLTSTSEVYGDPLVHPQPESYAGNVNPIGPRACYDEGKRAAETLMFDYHRTHNLRIKVVRIFNTYGPNMAATDGRVISNFVTQALRGEPITIYGNGEQTRSFCYVNDLIDGLIRMMESPIEVLGPINLGNPQETSIRELAEIIADQVGVPLHIEHAELPEDDPIRRRPDITKAQQLLGWEPTIDLATGLTHTIAWFRGDA